MPNVRLRDPHAEVLGAVLVVAVLLIGVSIAESGEPVVVAVDTVSVTATPIMAEEEVNLYGGTVTLVGRQQVEDLSAQDLPSALRLLPGVAISRYNLIGS